MSDAKRRHIAFPVVDPRTKYVGTSALRTLNTKSITNMSETMVLQDAGDTPIAVIVPYAQYLKMQEAYFASQEVEIHSKTTAGEG